jgi:hypothetical protein
MRAVPEPDVCLPDRMVPVEGFLQTLEERLCKTLQWRDACQKEALIFSSIPRQNRM